MRDHGYGASASCGVVVYVPVFASTKSYCLVTEAHGCEQLSQSRYTAALGQQSNSWPLDHKFNTPPLCRHAQILQKKKTIYIRKCDHRHDPVHISVALNHKPVRLASILIGNMLLSMWQQTFTKQCYSLTRILTVMTWHKRRHSHRCNI